MPGLVPSEGLWSPKSTQPQQRWKIKYTIYGAVSTRVCPTYCLEPNKKRSLLSCHLQNAQSKRPELEKRYASIHSLCSLQSLTQSRTFCYSKTVQLVGMPYRWMPRETHSLINIHLYWFSTPTEREREREGFFLHRLFQRERERALQYCACTSAIVYMNVYLHAFRST